MKDERLIDWITAWNPQTGTHTLDTLKKCLAYGQCHLVKAQVQSQKKEQVIEKIARSFFCT